MARNLEARLNSYWPIALTVFRVMFGLLFLCQGLTKLIGWPVVAHKAAVGEWPILLRGMDRTGHQRADHCRPVHPACGVHCMRRDGVRILHRSTCRTDSFRSTTTVRRGDFCFAFFLLIFAGGGAYAADARRGRWRSAVAPRRTGLRRNRRLLRR